MDTKGINWEFKKKWRPVRIKVHLILCISTQTQIIRVLIKVLAECFDIYVIDYLFVRNPSLLLLDTDSDQTDYLDRSCQVAFVQLTPPQANYW